METDDDDGKAANGTPNATSERRSSRRVSESARATCLKGSCAIEETDNNNLRCQRCERFFHYRCTGLPVFQIQHFVHSKNYRKFTCESCTKVAEHLKTVIPAPPSPDPSKQVLDLEKTIKEKQMEVDTLAETNRLLQAKIKELTASSTQSQKKYDNEKTKHVTLQAERKEMESNMKNEIASLQTSNAEKDTELKSARTAGAANGGDTLTTLTQLMGKKFEEVQNNLKSVILTEVTKNNKQLEEKINQAVQINKSFVDAVTNADNVQVGVKPPITNVDFRTVLRDERNEQLADEADKKTRACNFIVHGNIESNGEMPERKQHDKDFIDAFLRDIGIGASYKSISRLGTRDESSEQVKRPMKIVMQSEEDKDLVMSRLINLKGKETYKGISITDDHSIADRNIIKEWAEKAKTANANESADSLYEWKIRGSPKNGMRLKKFRKRTPTA